MSKIFFTSKKSGAKSKPAVNEWETKTDAIPTPDTSGCQPVNPSKINPNVAEVETKICSTPVVDPCSYQANSSKTKVKKIHAETQKKAVPAANKSSYTANQSRKEVNVINIGTVDGGTISIGNQYFTRYETVDPGGYPTGFSSPRRRNLPTISEELKSCTSLLSVDNMYHIADHIGVNWKRLARMLPDTNFSDGQLDTLRRASEDQTDFVVNILTKWYEVAPSTATVGNLAKTLEKMNLNDLAMGLETK